VRRRYVFGAATPYSMFIDDVGEARLRRRIDEAAQRFDFESGEARYAESVYSARTSLVEHELDTFDALGQPIGVPLAVWHEMQLVQAQAAEAERRLTSAPLHRADWRGVHSADDSQPTSYSAGTRGSERLRAGYDFEGLHRLILEAQASGDAERARRLMLYFNVLAQFAPTLRVQAAGGVPVVIASKRARSAPPTLGTVIGSEVSVAPAAALVERLDSLGLVVE